MLVRVRAGTATARGSSPKGPGAVAREEDPMEESKVVTIEVLIEETSERTDAKAVMGLREARFTGWGRAKRNPSDPNVPLVGEELAVARALVDLSHQLLEAATARIEAQEGHRVHVRL
jgi:hypothetical protein